MNYLRILAWLLVLGLVLATVVPAPERLETGLNHIFEHFLAFSVVGFIFAHAHFRFGQVYDEVV